MNKILASSLTTGKLHLNAHERYWGDKSFKGRDLPQETLLKLFRSDSILSFNIPEAEKYDAMVRQFKKDNLSIQLLLASGLDGFEAGKQAAKAIAQFPDSVIDQFPQGVTDACFSFSVTQLQQRLVTQSRATSYTCSNGKVIYNAAVNTEVLKGKVLGVDMEYYLLEAEKGEILLFPLSDSIELEHDFNQLLSQLVNNTYELDMLKTGQLSYPLIEKTQTPINIQGLAGAYVPNTEIYVCDAKGIMEFELSTSGYTSRTEASMLSAKRGIVPKDFQERIESNFIIMNRIDGKIVEAVYIPFDMVS